MKQKMSAGRPKFPLSVAGWMMALFILILPFSAAAQSSENTEAQSNNKSAEAASVHATAPSNEKATASGVPHTSLEKKDSECEDYLLKSKEDLHCSNFFIISAIKTVAGEAPDDEFFDINLKFVYNEKFFTLGSLDIALSETSASSSRDRLEEAGLSLNYVLHTTTDVLGTTTKITRQLFTGAQLKVFEGVSYMGPYIGSFELKASRFHTSYFTVGYGGDFFVLIRCRTPSQTKGNISIISI